MLLTAPPARLLAGALFSLLLSACSNMLPRDSLPSDLPEQVLLADTPFFPQERYQCGPASLAMLLRQRGIAVVPDELVARVYLPERQGSVAPEMIATARSYGMVVYELPPTLNALLRELAAGNPVLLLQNLGFDWLPQWHYAVAIGYDLTRQQITLHSGTRENYPMSLGLFDRTWRRGSRWGIVVLQPGRLPATNAAPSYLNAAYALEQTGKASEALIAYRSGAKRWPGRSAFWLATANLEYRQGLYAQAEATLRAGLVTNPRAARIWNNLAYALVRQGCRERALEALFCAIAIEPDELEYRSSLEEISTSKERGGSHCAPLGCPVSGEVNH